jgi:uncharacterized membrane protein
MLNNLVHGDVMLAIAMMALATIALRLGGFFLMGYLPLTPRVRRMLKALPGSVIASAVLPVALQGGIVAASAVVMAMVVMYLARSDIVAVLSGVGIAALMRATGIGG